MSPSLPPPGVSSLNQDGSHTVGSGPDIRPPSKLRSADVHLDNMVKRGEVRQVEVRGGKSGPPKRVVHEIDLNIQNRELGVATWVSADGKRYRLKYKDARTGKFFPNALTQMQLCILRELILDPTGQSALGVVSAFKIKMTDTDDNPLFPLNIEMIRAARTGGGGVIADDNGTAFDGEEPQGFTIGEGG